VRQSRDVVEADSRRGPLQRVHLAQQLRERLGTAPVVALDLQQQRVRGLQAFLGLVAEDTQQLPQQFLVGHRAHAPCTARASSPSSAAASSTEMRSGVTPRITRDAPASASAADDLMDPEGMRVI
jgi:hypothetical protein